MLILVLSWPSGIIGISPTGKIGAAFAKIIQIFFYDNIYFISL